MSDELETAMVEPRETSRELKWLREVNGELLEALRLAMKYGNFDPLSDQTIIRAGRAAIAKAQPPRLRDEGSSREDSFFEPMER